MTSVAPAPRFDPSVDDPFEDFPATGFGPGIRSRLTLASDLVLRRRKPKLVYAAVVVVGVLAIVVTQLLLSVGLSNGAYQIESLQAQQKTIDRSNSDLQEKLDSLSSPQNLAASAQSLGMVSNSNPVYLRLSDGAVLGTPKVATVGAGTFTGGQSSLVPPAATVAPTPVTAPAGTTAAGGAGAAGTAAATTTGTTAAGAPAAASTDATVPWSGDLPSPTTH